MANDLNGLSAKQLNDLILKAEQRKTQISAERKNKLREKLTALAAAEGFTIADLFGLGKARKGKRAAVAPKYKNPANSSQTWSGRGRQPAWYRDAVAAGKKEKDLLI